MWIVVAIIGLVSPTFNIVGGTRCVYAPPTQTLLRVGAFNPALEHTVIFKTQYDGEFTHTFQASYVYQEVTLHQRQWIYAIADGRELMPLWIENCDRVFVPFLLGEGR